MGTSDQKPNRKRPVLRFSLRTFLIVVTLLCVWLAWYAYRVERQKKAVSWIRENGGTVTYDYELNSLGGYDPESQPPGPKWLQNIFGVDYYSTVISVSLEGENFSDLTPLATGLPRLKVLSISATHVHDLKPLSTMTRLEWFSLQGTRVLDLTPLFDLKNLNEFSYGRPFLFTDEEIVQLKKALPNCYVVMMVGF